MRPLRSAGLLLFALAPSAALAHPGHDGMSGFTAGLIHPLTGLDHLAAMLMVGLWAGLALKRHIWAPPAAFVAFMLAGFAYGVAGGALPIAEMMILASLIVFGLAVTWRIGAPVAAAIAVIALFAFAHGFAHGTELPAGGSAWAFAAGFASITALLHFAGVALAQRTAPAVARSAGAAAAIAGVALMIAT